MSGDHKATKAQTRATAYHEAGHSVIGRVLGLICGKVTIIPDNAETTIPDNAETTAGYSMLEVAPSIAYWERKQPEAMSQIWTYVHRAYIIMMMAGEEAQVCIGHCAGGGDDDDRHNIEKALSGAGAPGENEEMSVDEFKRWMSGAKTRVERPVSAAVRERDEWVAKMRTKTTRRYVRRHRVAIEEVAKALMEHGPRSAQTIDQIMKRSGSRLIVVSLFGVGG
jgi:hypothetical protein